MTTDSNKNKPKRRLKPMRATPRTTDPVGVHGELNTIFSEWLARIPQTIGSFAREKSRRSPEPSGAESRPPLTINEQVRSFYQFERLDRAGGVYRPSRRHRGNIEPLDELLGPAGEELKDKD